MNWGFWITTPSGASTWDGAGIFGGILTEGELVLGNMGPAPGLFMDLSPPMPPPLPPGAPRAHST
ncbi:Hypothetical protein A7982_04342 [Minicystis rosea]|nr:Hypothetical protein A7982_04342 [Minicystis rosea]